MAPTPKKKAPRRNPAPQKGYDPCSCVSYARYASGINVGRIGYAINHPVNSPTPRVGGLVVTYEGRKTGHIAAITAVSGDTFTITEANYIRCQVGTRTLKIGDPRIKGFYN